MMRPPSLLETDADFFCLTSMVSPDTLRVAARLRFGRSRGDSIFHVCRTCLPDLVVVAMVSYLSYGPDLPITRRFLVPWQTA